MPNGVYRGSQSLLDVVEEVPPIPVEPVQGFQAELGLVYLYNPDAANTLVANLNNAIGDVNKAVEDITQLVVDALKIKPYSMIPDVVEQYTPCVYENTIYVATNDIEEKPVIFDPSQWTKVGTADYNQLLNKPEFITKADLSCTATGLEYNSSTGNLSLVSGYVIPTTATITQLSSDVATTASNLATETQNRINAVSAANSRIDGVAGDLTDEITNRTNADTALSGNISNVNGLLIAHTSATNNPHSVTKAQVGLGNVNNTADIDKPISTATQQALTALSGNIGTVSANLINNYRTAAAQDIIDGQITNQIGTVSGNLTTEATARSQADAALGARITTIEGKIPTAASSSNQLADKAFVNSSISNMAASYITASASGNAFGDYARLSQGPWYFQGEETTPTEHDYAVVLDDETHNHETSRYTFDGSQWDYQYKVNDTPFTQAQIDAINSTITAGLVTQYSSHVADTNNPHSVTKAQVGLGNCDNTSDLDKPISTATQEALNSKQGLIADLDEIRAGAAAGATAIQQAELDAYQLKLTASTGVSIDSDQNISNTGVLSVTTGTANGTVSVNTGGTTADVSVYGLGSAAYTESSDYATTAQGAKADNAADKSLSNLTGTGANITNWSSNVTNCITEIPQDINLELSDGTLKLKAGSKVYVPNGLDGNNNPQFNVYTVPSDITKTTTTNSTWFAFVSNNGILDILNKVYSGSSAPTGFGTYAVWYDTTNNLVKMTSDSGSTWTSGWSFPVGLVTSTNSAISSIDQVFNGFGYIGSTNFTLPGVKGLIPNGRNPDGTLKSILYTVENTGIYTQNIYEGTHYFTYTVLSQHSGGDKEYHIVDSLPDISTVATWVRYYVPADNYIYYKENSNDTIYTKEQAFVCGTIDFENNSVQSIKKLNINTPFQAADINDVRKLPNPDLSNLTQSGKNIGNWSSNVTNCTKEIPQDIKLELNNGTLTLKAGSKVYVPAGFEADGITHKFNVVTIENDLVFSGTFGSQNRTSIWSIAADDTGLTSNVSFGERSLENTGSGTSTPSTTTQYYNTSENIIHWSGTQNTRVSSFPLCHVTITNGTITSIDQVFNGIGCIGSTIFALPGVSGLVPNGRNADGTLNNNAFRLSAVKTYNVSTSGTYDIRLSASVLQTGDLLYNPDDNYNYVSSYIQSNLRFHAVVGRITVNSDKIIQAIYPKTTFHVVDYNDSEYIAHCAMPSSRNLDLTLSASGTSYTAPADGWLFLNKTQGIADARIEMYNQSSKQRTLCIGSSSTGQWIYGSMQAKKGDVIEVVYSATGTTNRFCFIYANGAK